MGNDESPDTSFHPISDSDFSKLDEAGRTDILKTLMRRHNELRAGQKKLDDGQKALGYRLDAHGKSITATVRATKEVRETVSRLDASMVDNTNLTKAALDGIGDLKTSTGDLVKGYNNLRTTATTVEWLSKFALRVAVPGGLIIGGYKAFTTWLPSLLHMIGIHQ